MNYKLYGASVSPFVRKVRLVLEEKSIPYELETVNPTQPSEEFLARSPLGKIPVLTDTSGEQEVVVPDSSIICDYLERRHPDPELVPQDPIQRAATLWLEEHSDGGLVPCVGPAVFRRIVLAQLAGEEPDIERANACLRDDAPKLLDYYEKELTGNEFFIADRLTLADIAVASPFVNLQHAGCLVPADRWPGLAAFLERMFHRPSFKRCIEEEAMFNRPVDLTWD